MTELTKRELVRAAELLKETDPRSSEYHVLLRSIEYLDSMGKTLDDIAELIDWEIAEMVYCGIEADAAGESSAIKARKPIDNLTPFPGKKEPVPEPAEPAPLPEPTPITDPQPEPAETEAEPTYSAAQVRKALVDARSKGVDIKAVLAKVGADNFQGVPASKYGSIMKELGVV